MTRTTSSIFINGVEYDQTDRKISIGNNAYIIAPIFMLDNNHLTVSNLYLIAGAIDGVNEIKYKDNIFNVTLEGIAHRKLLTINKVEGANTQIDRKNEVSIEGDTITQISNNGKHIIAVTLESDGQIINDTNEVIYSIESNGNMGMTSPESSGADHIYTYGLYPKYKNGDYSIEEVGTYTRRKRLIVPGKGHIDLIFVLEAEEYII